MLQFKDHIAQISRFGIGNYMILLISKSHFTLSIKILLTRFIILKIQTLYTGINLDEKNY